MKKVICKSGVTGWQAKLHKIYSSLDEFTRYCELYSIHTRIGFHSINNAWMRNPTIQGSVIPSDLRRVK